MVTIRTPKVKMVGTAGIEPATSRIINSIALPLS
jgi:hypothetical protein